MFLNEKEKSMNEGMSLKELAETIGVSRTTVSRVIAGHAQKYRISKTMEQKVRLAAERYGLVRNEVAHNLRMQKTDTVALMIPEVDNPFFSHLAHVVEHRLRESGRMVLLCSSSEDSAIERQVLSMIRGRQIDGLLVAPVGTESTHFKALERSPVVFVDRYLEDLAIPYVTTDNRRGGFLGAQYLIERGHREIAIIQGLPEAVSNQDRVVGISQVLSQLDKAIEVVGHGFTIENGHESTLRLLDKETRPTAIFTLGNQVALGAMQAIQSRGLRIPDDISLISFDDQPYFALTCPPLTAVKQPIDLIAESAVQMLLARLESSPVSSKRIHPHIVERKSVSQVS
ncbi:MAG: LacI family DNA-binding transcriptional regulator [Bacteroidota bacterium]